MSTLVSGQPVVDVRLSNGRAYRPAKAVLAAGVLRVWAADPQPTLVYESPVTVDLESGVELRLRDPEGQLIRVRRGGCGCGNPIRSFTPPEGAQ